MILRAIDYTQPIETRKIFSVNLSYLGNSSTFDQHVKGYKKLLENLNRNETPEIAAQPCNETNHGIEENHGNTSEITENVETHQNTPININNNNSNITYYINYNHYTINFH